MENPVRVRLDLHPRRDLALRYAEGSAPAPVATTAHSGKPNSRSELRIGINWGQGHRGQQMSTCTAASRLIPDRNDRTPLVAPARSIRRSRIPPGAEKWHGQGSGAPHAFY